MGNFTTSRNPYYFILKENTIWLYTIQLTYKKWNDICQCKNVLFEKCKNLFWEIYHNFAKYQLNIDWFSQIYIWRSYEKSPKMIFFNSQKAYFYINIVVCKHSFWFCHSSYFTNLVFKKVKFLQIKIVVVYILFT